MLMFAKYFHSFEPPSYLQSLATVSDQQSIRNMFLTSAAQILGWTPRWVQMQKQ